MESNINLDYCLPCFGKAIVDAKDIYTDYLLNILAPLIYEGIRDIYTQALKYEVEAQEKAKKDPKFKNPGVTKIFLHLLSLFKDMNNINIEDEAKRIKNGCGCAEIFDDLIKAVVKSHIAVLTCTVKEPKILKENKFHETVNINTFIHKCYMESIKFIHDNPEYFEGDEHKNKKNQQIVQHYIKLGIKDAIKQILPMRQILEEFLSNNYEENYDNYMEKIKKMLVDNVKLVGTTKEVNLLEDTEHKKVDMERLDFDLDEFIVGKPKETLSLVKTIPVKTEKNESLLQ